MKQAVGLGRGGLDTAFPFHFAMDRDGRVIQCGPSLSRICPTLMPGACADDLLRIVRPPMAFRAEDLIQTAPEFVVIEVAETGFVLRGQTLVEGSSLLFLGSPWLTAPQQLLEHNLSLGDFALHDPVVDYLSLLDTKNLALSDATRFAEALHQANARLSTLIARLPYGVLTEDESGRVALTNEAFCCMFGILAPPAALVGADCSEAAKHSKHLFVDPDGFVTGIEQRLREGKPVVGDVLELCDGRTFERDFVPIFEGAQHRGQLWQYRDVTERRRAEKELLAARARAEDANEAKSSFVAMMSHEMRTPLGVIVGLSDLLSQPLANRDREDYLGRLRANASALLTLIDDVLDFSKLEAGRVELQATPFDVRELVDDVASTMTMRAEQKGIALKMSYDEHMPRLLSGDAARLRQILINLVNNAIKFTDHGKVELSLELVLRQNESVRVRYAVSDTGCGIPADKQHGVFERFVRVEREHGPRAEGTGLGLSICRALVEKMGSHFTLTSEPGQGSCFAFEVEHAVAEFQVPGVGARPIAGPRDRRGGLLLMAEDDPDNREVMRRMLVRAGYEVDTAIDGSVAYEKARTLDYDLLLTDLQMPSMDGLELTQRLRDLESHGLRPRLPVVAVTAHAIDHFRQKGLEAGMDAYRTKPIRGDDLIDAVELHIDRRPRVLIIDDSPDSLLVTAKLLARTGQVRVLTERDGAAAVLRLSRTPVSLVLLDASMPGMSGEAVARAIRALPLDRQPTIVAFTGHEHGVEVQRMLQAGCNAYLQKPVNAAKLEAVANRYALVQQGDGQPPAASELDTQGSAGFDPDIYDLIPGYLANRLKDVDKLRTLAREGAQATAIQAIGHQLKGSGRAYGLPEITELGVKVEATAEAGERADLLRAIEELERFVLDVQGRLQGRTQPFVRAR